MTYSAVCHGRGREFESRRPRSLKNSPKVPPLSRGHKISTGNNSLVFDCLNTKLFKSLETVHHGFEFFGGVPPPIYNLTYNTKQILRAV
jgi:hypothetical protein